MGRWALPLLGAAGVAAVLVLMLLSPAAPPPSAPGTGKPVTLLRATLLGVDDAGPGRRVVRTPSLRLVLSGRRATLESVGPQSDAFLYQLDHVCNAGYLPRKMRAAALFSAQPEEGAPEDLGRGPVTLRLSFESEPDERYAELYAAVDPSLGALSLQERDDAYCGPLVRYLMEAPQAP